MEIYGEKTKTHECVGTNKLNVRQRRTGRIGMNGNGLTGHLSHKQRQHISKRIGRCQANAYLKNKVHLKRVEVLLLGGTDRERRIGKHFTGKQVADDGILVDIKDVVGKRLESRRAHFKFFAQRLQRCATSVGKTPNTT
jgi:hypothetical protein